MSTKCRVACEGKYAPNGVYLWLRHRQREVVARKNSAENPATTSRKDHSTVQSAPSRSTINQRFRGDAMNAEELDLVETDALTDALARRFDAFLVVGRRQLRTNKNHREMAWGGDLRDVAYMAKMSEEYLLGRLDEQNDPSG